MEPDLWPIYTTVTKTMQQLAKEEREREGPELPWFSVINAINLVLDEKPMNQAFLNCETHKLGLLVHEAIMNSLDEIEQDQLSRWREFHGIKA